MEFESYSDFKKFLVYVENFFYKPNNITRKLKFGVEFTIKDLSDFKTKIIEKMKKAKKQEKLDAYTRALLYTNFLRSYIYESNHHMLPYPDALYRVEKDTKNMHLSSSIYLNDPVLSLKSTRKYYYNHNTKGHKLVHSYTNWHAKKYAQAKVLKNEFLDFALERLSEEYKAFETLYANVSEKEYDPVKFLDAYNKIYDCDTEQLYQLYCSRGFTKPKLFCVDTDGVLSPNETDDYKRSKKVEFYAEETFEPKETYTIFALRDLIKKGTIKVTKTFGGEELDDAEYERRAAKYYLKQTGLKTKFDSKIFDFKNPSYYPLAKDNCPDAVKILRDSIDINQLDTDYFEFSKYYKKAVANIENIANKAKDNTKKFNKKLILTNLERLNNNQELEKEY